MTTPTIRTDAMTRAQQVTLERMLHPLDGVRPGEQERGET